MESNGNGAAVETMETTETTESTESYYCEICGETFNESEAAHKLSYLHKARVEYLEGIEKKKEWDVSKGYAGHIAFTGVKTELPPKNTTIEILTWVPICRKPLIGMEHIVEIVPQFGGRRYYLCTLCNKCDIQVFAHMCSIEHVTNYLAHHWEELKEEVEAYFADKEKEWSLIQPFIEAKGWPIMDTRNDSEEVKAIRKVLLDLSVKLTSKKGNKKKFSVNIEIDGKAPGKKRPVQQALVKQLIGHTVKHYPYDLYDALYYYGENFAYDPPAGMDEDGNFNQGFDDADRPDGVMTMGQLKSKKQDPIPFLYWLQKTEAKVLTQPLDEAGIEAAESVKGLLSCGIELFQSNPSPPTSICYYKKEPVNESLPLNQWMVLTNSFFEEAWMCSQREVAAANALIGYIEKAIIGAKAGKVPQPDPYDELTKKAAEAPFAKSGGSSSGVRSLMSGAMGGGYGDGYGYGGGPMRGSRGYGGYDDGYGYGGGYGGGPYGRPGGRGRRW